MLPAVNGCVLLRLFMDEADFDRFSPKYSGEQPSAWTYDRPQPVDILVTRVRPVDRAEARVALQTVESSGDNL